MSILRSAAWCVHDSNQSKGIARPLTTLRHHRPQQSWKREQDCDGLCADDIHNLARAGALRIEEVNLAPASSAVMVSLERHQIP
jgi:hypothetical protein